MRHTLKYFLITSFFFLSISVLTASESDKVCIKSLDVNFLPNGDVVAVWVASNSKSYAIHSNIKIGSKWRNQQMIPLKRDDEVFDLKSAAVSHNIKDVYVVAVWLQRNTKGVVALYGAMLSSVNQKWTNVAQISANYEDVQECGLSVGQGEKGNVVVTWTSTDPACNRYIRSSTSKVNFFNAWSSPVFVSGP